MKTETLDGKRIRKLRDYYAKHRVVPSYAEIAKLMQFASKAAAYKFVQRAEKAGLLQKGPTGRLAPTEDFLGLPLVGSIRAGKLEPFGEYANESIDLGSYFRERNNDSCLVEVKGDSMIDAGIVEGDLAVISRGRTPKEGDLVGAIIGGDATLKVLGRVRGAPALLPRNSSYKPVLLKGEPDFVGVCVGIVRRLG
jgi:SOS-response transcriptional repressor LexA